MGMHDRDYYREDYASKNGMRYDKRNARYHWAGFVKSQVPLSDHQRLWRRNWMVLAVLVILVLAVVAFQRYF